jgi:hypothetical protein
LADGFLRHATEPNAVLGAYADGHSDALMSASSSLRSAGFIDSLGNVVVSFYSGAQQCVRAL